MPNASETHKKRRKPLCGSLMNHFCTPGLKSFYASFVRKLQRGHTRVQKSLRIFEIDEADARRIISDAAQLISDEWRGSLRQVGVSGTLAREYEAAFVNDQTEIALAI